MSIADIDGAFGAASRRLRPATAFPAGRTPLNVAAAQVAATPEASLHHAGHPRRRWRALADFVGLALASVAILWLYVAPLDGDGARLSRSPRSCCRPRPSS